MKLRYSDFASRVDIDALTEALEIDFVDNKGNEMKAHCPLPYNSHTNGDTTGKFSINREKRVWGCWVCGGGSLLDLVMTMKDLDPEPATKWIYQFANHEETEDEFFDELSRLLADPADSQPSMPFFNFKTLERFESAVGHPWLASRGISNEVAKNFSLRYSSTSQRTNGSETYVGESIILPHVWRNRLVGWQQRWLGDDRPKWVPKYTMTPDFPKNETLFAYDTSVIPARLGDMVIVVESVPSALYLWSNRCPAMATYGSSVSESQLKLLRKFGRVTLAPDNDEAGLKWSHALESYLENYIEVSVLPVLDGAGSDIGDLAEGGPEYLRAYLGMAYNSIDAIS